MPLATLAVLPLAALLFQQPPAPSPATSAAPRRPPGCTRQEARQFDFWAGDWDVYVRGALGGHNLIAKAHAGCAIIENWTGGGGSTGTSVNFYDPEKGKWHQTWAGNGGFLFLDGAWDGERMVLEGDRRGPDGTVVKNRITWTPLPGGQLRQVWETSTGSGAWTIAFDGHYVPKGSAPPKPAAAR